MATISSNGKVAYVYEEDTDTWHPVAGSANTAANYEWSGAHTFNSTVIFEDAITSFAGINNFQNPAARDAAISSPSNGVIAFVRQDADGNVINQIQYYSGLSSSWVNYTNAMFTDVPGNYTLGLKDINKTIWTTSLTDVIITVPENIFPVGATMAIVRGNSGEVTISPAAGTTVTLRSKNSNDRISLPYSGIQLTHKANNEWIMIGDLKD